MQVVSVGSRSPFVADEGGETPRFIVFFCGRRLALPRRAGNRRLRTLERVLELLHGRDPHIESGAGALNCSLFEEAMNLLAPLRLEQGGVGCRDHGREAEVLGMVRHDQEIQRTCQLGRQAGVRRDLFAAGKAIGLLRSDYGSDQAGVGGIGRVQVRVAEEHPVREVLGRIGRIGHLSVGRWDLSVRGRRSIRRLGGGRRSSGPGGRLGVLGPGAASQRRRHDKKGRCNDSYLAHVYPFIGMKTPAHSFSRRASRHRQTTSFRTER